MYPRWLSLLVLVFFGYLVYLGTHNKAEVSTKSANEQTIPTMDAKTYPALTEATDIEHWKRAINPDYAARAAKCALEAKDSSAPALTLKSIDDVAGEGDPAKCTDTITVNLTVWNAKGRPAWRGETDLTLGAHAVAAGLDASLVGLRVGGIRTLILPPAALTHEKKSDAPHALLAALRSDGVVLVTASRVQ